MVSVFSTRDPPRLKFPKHCSRCPPLDGRRTHSGMDFRVFWIWIIFMSGLSVIISGYELALVVGQPTVLQIVPGLPVKVSPSSKPGSLLVGERVQIQGLSRINNLKRFSHSVRVKVALLNRSSSIRLPNVEVCFHRNSSLGIAMCPESEWEKLSKGSWVRTMSPFDHKILDIRMAASSTEAVEVSIEEEFFMYRIVFLMLGTVLWTLAPTLSNSLVFYYSSAMVVGIFLVILIVLFQGMKLLPTGRRNSLAIFLYSSLVGIGGFLLRYLPALLHSILSELGVSEDLYNPLAIFLFLFIALAGAWLGFWAVRKLVLTEEGSIDESVSLFVAWSIRILAFVMIVQCSLDPLLAGAAFLGTIFVPPILRRVVRRRLLCNPFRYLIKAVQISHQYIRESDCSPSKVTYKGHADHLDWSQDAIHRRHSRSSTLDSSRSPVRGLARTPPSRLSDSETFLSTFHKTPERKKYSKEEWDSFTKECTKKALKDMVSSPEFNKWAVAHAERITLVPTASSRTKTTGWKTWFWWFR